MNIDFHLPYGKVSELQINRIRKHLTKLHHQYSKILRVQVLLKESPGAEPRIRSCTIELEIFGESLFIQRTAASYEEAIEQTLEALTEKTTERLKHYNALPDITTSTVKI